jgi:hypothetical protein
MLAMTFHQTFYEAWRLTGKKVTKKSCGKKPVRQTLLSLKRSDLAVYFIAKLHYFEGYVLKERESVQDFYFYRLLY